MKPCTGCGVTKPLDQFPLALKGKFGRGAKCSQCTALWRAERKEQTKQYNAEYYSDNSGRVKERVRAYQKATNYQVQKNRDPIKTGARLKLMKALATGKIQKSPCFCCGDEAEAHHPDYSQPLSVVWLCRKHHQEIHNGR